MQRIVYVPPGGNIELPSSCAEFSLSPPYIIGSVKGTGGAEASAITSTAPGVNGVFVHGVRMESREISCFIHVEGETRKDMYQKRFDLVKKLTPQVEPGLLYYTNDAEVKRIPAYPMGSPDFTDRLQNYNRAELKFMCPSPYWEDTVTQEAYMAYLDGGFEFPFEFDVEFAAQQNRTEIVNAGSVPVPIEIVIRGPSDSPTIRNETTGEHIHVRQSLAEGDALTIRTKPGSKSVRLMHKGVEEDAFQFLDLSSTLFQLRPGSNRLRYESENESEFTQIVIRYRELYAGV